MSHGPFPFSIVRRHVVRATGRTMLERRSLRNIGLRLGMIKTAGR
jgi:hypothetical protein